ncbi:FKBP-type peptidyl-prolyl cis-trans isomerase [Candidatus Woesearchaeota archaeon]|nr:FKBP-type peptidyl-prolyl cis-trans isomerase [Candidatus Woesearchaeota archaeon]
MQLKKGDFIEVEYTGTIKDSGIVFDTTDEKLAKESGIHSPQMTYGPIIVCLGEGHLISGLDEQMTGKETGQEYTIELGPDQAFGRKDAKLIQLISTSKFTKQNINPVPGLQVNVDGAMGIIRRVSGGRTLVDFNHPLSGQDIVYKIKVNKIVEDKAEQVKSLIQLQLGIKEVEVKVENDIAEVKLKKETPMPEQLKEKLKENIMQLVKLKDLKLP